MCIAWSFEAAGVNIFVYTSESGQHVQQLSGAVCQSVLTSGLLIELLQLLMIIIVCIVVIYKKRMRWRQVW